MRQICFCNSNLAWGGGEKWHLEAAIFFACKGFKVHIFCHPSGALYPRILKAAKEASVHERLAVHPLAVGTLSFLNPAMRFKVRRFFAAQRIHAVIMNLPSDLKLFAPAARKADVPEILFRRGSALPVKNSAINRWLYGEVVTGVIANSQETAIQIVQNNPDLLQGKPLYILPNGIDCHRFTEKLQEAEPLLSFPEGQDRPLVLGNAGRLNKQKGQYLLLHLCVALKHLGVDHRLLLAGTGELEESLKALANKLGVADRVIFCGFMEDLSPFWKSIDIFVLSSLWEGFGYVLLEAMLAKKPLAAFGVSNIPELVHHGKNGLLFDMPDLHRPDMMPMAKALADISREQMQEMGNNGFDFANKNFSQQVIMKYLESVIRGEPAPTFGNIVCIEK